MTFSGSGRRFILALLRTIACTWIVVKGQFGTVRDILQSNKRKVRVAELDHER